jgi:hypothetical protein
MLTRTEPILGLGEGKALCFADSACEHAVETFRRREVKSETNTRNVLRQAKPSQAKPSQKKQIF